MQFWRDYSPNQPPRFGLRGRRRNPALRHLFRRGLLLGRSDPELLAPRQAGGLQPAVLFGQRQKRTAGHTSSFFSVYIIDSAVRESPLDEPLRCTFHVGNVRGLDAADLFPL